MDEMEQAHHELERLQGIISRHEGHIFALRGWLLTVVGGILAAHYSDHIALNEPFTRIALPGIVLLFLILELRHTNLVEAVVERVAALEARIADARRATGPVSAGWYDGPKVNAACHVGANRWWPGGRGMTFVLNQPFYIVVILLSLLAAFALPSRKQSALTTVPQTTNEASRALPSGSVR